MAPPALENVERLPHHIPNGVQAAHLVPHLIPLTAAWGLHGDHVERADDLFQAIEALAKGFNVQELERVHGTPLGRGVSFRKKIPPETPEALGAYGLTIQS